MFKKIFSLLSVVVIVFHIETTNVTAAVNEVDIRIEGNEEITSIEEFVEVMKEVQGVDEALEFDLDMPNEIFIDLPEEIVWENEEPCNILGIESKAVSYGIKGITDASTLGTVSLNVMATSSVPSGAYTNGVATSTTAIAGMDKANQNTYPISRTGSTQSTYFKFGDKTTSLMAFPGMEVTNVCGESCKEMTPQGIEYYGGYFFLTAYCGEDDKYEKPVHKAVIYVMDSSKKYITTLVTTENNHAGGIAYANGYLWVCSGGKSVSYYKYSEIIDLINFAKQNSNVKSILLTSTTHGNLTTTDNADFCTTYKGNLCIGTFEETESCKLKFYNPIISSTGKLSATTEITKFPKQLQGVVFQVVNEKVYLLLAASYGRNNKSNVYIYEAGSSSLGSFAKTKEIQMPPMIEEAVICGSNIYFVFESCGKQYRDGGANIVIGNVCAFSRSFIFK